MTQKPARKLAQKKGLRAERLAAWLLRLKGYHVRAVNYVTPVGEIDIIATRGDVLAIVEVKSRAYMESAAYAITAHQRRRIERAASLWLSQNGGEQAWQIRFDAVLVASLRWPRHMMEAWRP